MVASHTVWAQPSRDIEDYVLFAFSELSFKGGNVGGTGFVDGNVGVNKEDLSPGTSPLMNVGVNGRIIMPDNSQLVGDSIRFGDEGDAYDVFVNHEIGAFDGTIRNLKQTFSLLNDPVSGNNFLILPADLPALDFTPGRAITDPNTATNVSLPNNTTLTLSPGDYGLVRPQDGSTLNLQAGTYNIHSLISGQNVTINTTNQTKLLIDDKLTLNGADFGVGTPGLAEIQIGNLSGDSSNFGAGGKIHGRFFSPLGQVRLGRGNDIYGHVWADHITSDFNINVFVPEPETLLLAMVAVISSAARRRQFVG